MSFILRNGHNGIPYLLAGLLWMGPTAMAAKYQDVYLNDNRVCKACRLEVVNPDSVRLTNREGHRVLVKPKDILGIDQHPVWRKLIFSSLHGIGLPGPVIVPNAFEDGRDYACKYCEPP
ncbi:hypothetical protein [Vampirovibrio sp.]|uniref:hypothetical protein n=1 Tax=Vampirovibrio sp. TaxID=2717857 RepID=UPI0035944A4C